jgi:hypothetical protein
MSITVAPFETIEIRAQTRDSAPSVIHIPNRLITWTATGVGGAFDNPTSLTDEDGIARVNFTAGADGQSHVITAHDSLGRVGLSETITVSTGDVGDPIQDLIDGLLDGAPAVLYEIPNGFPTDPTKRQLVAYTLATPAAPPGNLIDPDHIAIDLVDSSVAASFVGGMSLATTPKMLVINEGMESEITLSAGPAGSIAGDDPDVVLDNVNIASGDLVTINSLIGAAVEDPFDAILVTPSDLAPVQGASITVTSQARAGGSNFHRIGLTAVASLSVMSGSGGGSIASPNIVSSAHGTFEVVTVDDVGDHPTDEKVSIVSGAVTGLSADIVVADEVDSYTVTLPSLSPGPGTTVTATIQAKIGGSDAHVAGRAPTMSKTGLAGATFGTPTTTDAMGVATCSVTFGAIGSTGTITATDPQGETGTSGTITVAAAPPDFTVVLTDGLSDGSAGTSKSTGVVTIPPNSWMIVAAVSTTETTTVSLAATGLTIPTPLVNQQMLATYYYATTKLWFIDVGAGGFSDILTFGSEFDGFFGLSIIVGYFAKADAAGIIQSKISAPYADDTTTKTLTLDISPDPTSRLLAFWGLIQFAGSGPSMAPKAGPPAWTETEEVSDNASVFTGVLQLQEHDGTDDETEMTPTISGSSSVQAAILLEINHT